MQKRAIRTRSGLGPKEAFKELKILTGVLLYILETKLSAVKSEQTRMAPTTPGTGRIFCYSRRSPPQRRSPPTKEAARKKSALFDWLLDVSFVYNIQEFLNWRSH
ncbi:hypothetical protein J6590_005502 [Homalodisca vitripennis]|nr:hypothetical protein J6590_005502 [Homalodisca vitripennis]